MKVLFISGREPAYMRNAVILKGLREAGVEVIECTSPSASYFHRFPDILKKFILNREDYDVIFVGYFGQPLVPICAKLSSKPLIFDAFLSAYDTMCFDRKKFTPNSTQGKFFYWLDKHSCELSNKVFLDTNAHIDYFVKTFGLDRNKFSRIFVGADESVFYPRKCEKNDDVFRVFYYTTFHPLHGVEYIIKAAKKLEMHDDIMFRIIGGGMEYNKIENLVRELNIKNIEFINKMPYQEFYKNLPLEIANSDLCLGGPFSNIDKGKRVISEKTFEFIAMGKPVIVGDSFGNRELFENRRNALMVEHANSDALASAILELKEDEDLRSHIADEGYRTFKDTCTSSAIGKEIFNVVSESFTI
jgi:glycosyltransferase involved in cell wall biosynthesis